MKTPVVAAVSAVLGALVGAVLATVVATAIADEPARDVAPDPQLALDCADIVTAAVLDTMGWSDGSARPEERVGRCEWTGEPGLITVGIRPSPASGGQSDAEAAADALETACDDARRRVGYEATTDWLGSPALQDGCVVHTAGDQGMFEVIGIVEDDRVLQVRVAVLQATAPEDVRSAMRALVEAGARM